MRRSTPALIVLTVLAALLGGCETPPSHKPYIARREANLRATARQFESLEDGREENLNRTLQMAADQHEEDIANTERNGTLIANRYQWELDKWERSKREAQQWFEKEMAGDPANIERTLPKILY